MRTLLLLMILGWCALTRAQVVQLFGPNELGAGRTTLSFDEFPHATVADTLYSGIGLTFSRDDGGVTPILELPLFSIQTSSGSNGIATSGYPVVGPTQGFTTHLTIDLVQPLRELGAFFGNDFYIGEFGFERMTIYGANNELLGSIDVAVNNNTAVDQFIGLRSSTPFNRVRFENFTPSGTVSPGHAIVIDDLTFTTAVPEPSTYALFGLALATAYCVRRRRSRPRT